MAATLKNILFLALCFILGACNSSSSSADAVVLSIGDAYQGGFIFQKSGGGGKICATADNSSGLEWGTMSLEVGPAAQSATDGMANTNAIVTALGVGTSYAAGLCDAYEVDSEGNTPCQLGNTCYADWYLPSYQEMGLLFQQSTQLTLQNPALGGPITGIQAADYSTSTEATSTHSHTIDGASLGNAIFETKDSLSRVRCIRQF